MSAKSKQGKSKRGLVDQRLVKALGHPLRQRILHELGDEAASPNQLAERLGEPLGNVSYHVKILAECKAIKLVRTAPVRGALEHFYRAAAVPRLYEDEWTRLPRSMQRTLFKQTLGQIWSDVVDAGKADGFDDPRTHVSWTALELDDEAYDALLEEIEALIDRGLALQAEAKSRLAEQEPADRNVHSTELALMHFHREGAPAKRSSRRRRARR